MGQSNSLYIFFIFQQISTFSFFFFLSLILSIKQMKLTKLNFILSLIKQKYSYLYYFFHSTFFTSSHFSHFISFYLVIKLNFLFFSCNFFLFFKKFSMK